MVGRAGWVQGCPQGTGCTERENRSRKRSACRGDDVKQRKEATGAAHSTATPSCGRSVADPHSVVAAGSRVIHLLDVHLAQPALALPLRLALRLYSCGDKAWNAERHR